MTDEKWKQNAANNKQQNIFLANTITNAYETVEMAISFHEGKLSKYLEAATGGVL